MIIRWLGTYFPEEFPELQEDPHSDDWDMLLFSCALRFDGYTFETERAPKNKVTGQYLVEHCSAPLKELGRLHTDTLMNMGAMFILQRSVRDPSFVTKGTLENCSWLMVLYLELYQKPIPAAYRHADLYERFRKAGKEQKQQLAAIIRKALVLGCVSKLAPHFPPPNIRPQGQR